MVPSVTLHLSISLLCYMHCLICSITLMNSFVALLLLTHQLCYTYDFLCCIYGCFCYKYEPVTCAFFSITSMNSLVTLHVCLSLLQVFEGNTDSYSVKHSYLDAPIIARFLKFHTVHWNRHPSMRVEIIGCQGKTIIMGSLQYTEVCCLGNIALL